MSVMFRATRKYWLNEIIGPILLVLVCALVVLALDERRGLLLAIIAGIGSLTFLRTAILTWRTQLMIDDQGMRGRLHNRLVDLRWSDMHALRVVLDGQKKSWLQIGTASGGAQFLLDELDVTGVQRALERYAPPMILAADAFDRLPWAQKQRAADAALLAGVTGPVRVRESAWVPAVGWLGIVFFSSIGYLAWRDGSGIAGLLLVLFGLLEGYLLYAGYAVTEIGSETIRLTMPIWPTYEMRWDEVQLAELDYGENQFVLQGAGKQMIVPGPLLWRGTDKEVGLAAFVSHLEQRNIPLKRTGVAYFKFSKGTRVRRTGGKL